MENELEVKKSELKELTDQWESEKRAIDAVKNAKSDLEKAKHQLEQATREGDYGTASKIQYATIPELQDKIKELSKMNWLLNHPIFYMILLLLKILLVLFLK